MGEACDRSLWEKLVAEACDKLVAEACDRSLWEKLVTVPFALSLWQKLVTVACGRSL